VKGENEMQHRRGSLPTHFGGGREKRCAGGKKEGTRQDATELQEKIKNLLSKLGKTRDIGWGKAKKTGEYIPHSAGRGRIKKKKKP